MKRIMSRISIALFSLAVIGCSVNPVTGKNELSIISGAQEIAIGEKNYRPSQQAQGGTYYLDPELQSYVSEVGHKLAKVSHTPQLPFEFVVLNNSVPNAWALPGGKIAINRGLLIHLENEAELAAVMGHEIVHAAARHSASQMTRGTLIGAGAQILGLTLADSNYSQLANTAIQLGAAAWMARYGRSAELESDAYGMEYMAKAGYDPHGAVKLQQTFVKLSEGRKTDFISGLFASHPPSQDRVAANLEKAKTLPKGALYTERYQRKIAQLKKDVPAYEAQEEAIKALKNKDAKLALQHLDRATKIQPADGYFWELRGHAWKMQKNFGNAEKAFSTAIRKNPNLFSHYLARGVLRYEQEDTAGAKPDLEKSNSLLPTQAASYLLGEMALKSNDQDTAIKHYQNAAASGGKLGNQAMSRIAVIELPRLPHKYVLSKAYLNEDGYLMIAVKNQANITVQGVKVRLDKIVNGARVGASADFAIPGSLKAGQQRALKTNLGPFKSAEEAGQYRTKAVVAKAVEQNN